MPHLLERYALFYPMRIVGTLFLIVIVTMYAWQSHGFNAFYYVFVAVLAIHPHVVQHIARKYPQNRLKIETIAFLVDAFVLGLAIAATGFTPLPSFILTTVALVNSLAVSGFGQMMLTALALLAGVAAPLPFLDTPFAPRDVIALDIACAVFLFVYFMAFAYSSYNRSALLIQSQAELREQKAFLEIEKLRSDRLLLNLVPAPLAADLEQAGGIKPATFDPVTLIAIELRGFSRALQAQGHAATLAHLMHCFKAFDAIASRHGLEKLKTMGDTYIAVAGLPAPNPGHAIAGVEAALDVRDFLVDLAESRAAHGEFALAARVSVHTGAVVGGVVETAKISYDVWGPTVSELLCLLRAAADGEIAVSEATQRLAADAFAWTRGRVVECGGAAIACHRPSRRRE